MLRIACRASALSQIQAHFIGKALLVDYELITCSTAGDRNQEQALASIGGKGLFVKEVEQALLNEEADIAVHSLKDMPVVQPANLPIVAYSGREVVNDVLIGADSWQELPRNAKVGTCSPRRQFQMQILRPDLEFQVLRGNINTRINKLKTSELSAIILAEAGLVRANITDLFYTRFTIAEMLPAAGQGILAIQARPGLEFDLSPINDVVAANAAKAERSIVEYLGANCHSPLAVYAHSNGNNCTIEVKAGNTNELVSICKIGANYEQAIALTKKALDESPIKSIINS